LQSADEHIRAQAVGALCRLGELEPALDMASDPSPEVRAWLGTMLGSYRERSGAEVLERLLSDRYAEVAKEAKKALRLLGKLEKAKPGKRAKGGAPESAWSRLLGEISRVRLADSEVAVDVPDAMVEAGWLGEPGATEEQIALAEHRLGARLPPSYRQFLAESNGFRQLSPFIWRLRVATEIDWLRTRNTEWIEAYQCADDISPEEHQEAPLDSGPWRAAYLWSCLQISEEGDSAVVRLNPEVVTPEGEWEAWFFATWIPGAQRFRSFWDYLAHELKNSAVSTAEILRSGRRRVAAPNERPPG
jgi:cell wall assembly regulator SMI1